jgi:hypothetical protein
MIAALALSAVLAAEEAEPLPNSFAMYVSVAEPSVVVGIAGIGFQPDSAALRVGSVLYGSHALLFGVGFAASPVSTTETIVLSFLPTYRYFLTPLRAGGFSPFAQADLFVGYANGGGQSSVLFGLGGGFGGEYLFMRNFGVVVAGGLRFVHSEVTGVIRDFENTVGLWGMAALSLHF